MQVVAVFQSGEFLLVPTECCHQLRDFRQRNTCIAPQYKPALGRAAASDGIAVQPSYLNIPAVYTDMPPSPTLLSRRVGRRNL